MGKKGYTTFQWAIIVIGAILCFLPKYFISFEGLSVSGVQVLFILIGGLLIWQCVGVDWSSLLVIFAMCFIPEMGPKTAFSSSYFIHTFTISPMTVICWPSAVSPCLRQSMISQASPLSPFLKKDKLSVSLLPISL